MPAQRTDKTATREKPDVAGSKGKRRGTCSCQRSHHSFRAAKTIQTLAEKKPTTPQPCVASLRLSTRLAKEKPAILEGLCYVARRYLNSMWLEMRAAAIKFTGERRYLVKTLSDL
ncbi:hypothetical protein Y1Q_0004221 [Alligator mississippiensis]|uniref:Uncharacterized protein n=1 Tax=Alligator mississippiensis TaxID=8496 RepID=A0A151M7L5_ALLMI|nr:hypothetical protein Y1Q_0004221 [Alligator mississippiensis]